MRIEDYLINPSASVIEAMNAIDINTEGIVYVCDEDRTLLGAVTDGDIRRYIIHGGSLSGMVSHVMTSNPIKLPLSARSRANGYMVKFSITSIPIVDDNNIIQEIFFLDSSVRPVKKQIDAPVVIMAGGKGTRLQPYTQILPKPLIPIGEKTITEHIIDHFYDAGCKHFDMIVNYKRHFIKSYFRDVELPVTINFLDEDEFLGTAGGLRLLIGKYDQPFFMTNCDILIEDDYSKIMKYHISNNNIITIVSAIKNTTLPYGVIEATPDGKVACIKEKPDVSTVVNTGFYILSPKFLDKIPADTFIHITDVIKTCIDEGERVGMYPVSGDHWMDMGQMDELRIMTERLTDNI